MERKRKYFDEQGNETTADKGASCQELTLDDDGQAISETFYENQERPVFSRFNKQALQNRLRTRPELAK